ncbi:MAG: hypothetical protein HOP22_14390 [Nitrospiraceae bacterium]|nr:hypothetical protein [Nitrospiraceae bacterium]
MLPLLADQLSILMCPEWLLVAHRPRGFRPGPMTTTTVPVSASSEGSAGWEAAAAALEALLAANPQWRGASIRIVLSNHFVRYVLVPWSNDLSNEKEHLVLARRHFALTHGPVAKNWAIRMSLDNPGECHVASALDESLVSRLTLAATASHLKLTSLEPLLMASFNRWQQDFREESQWFVTVENGMLCGALVGRNRWIALRRWRIQDDWASELSLWLSREQLIGEESVPVGAVYLLAPPHAGAHSMAMGPLLRFLCEDDRNNYRNGTLDRGAKAVEEAGYLSCIL